MIFAINNTGEKKASKEQDQKMNDPSSSQTDSVFNKTQYSLTDPSSIWVIVNKQNPLPLSYKPDLTVPNVELRLDPSQEQMQINKTTEPALVEMFSAAKKDRINLVFGSGYRSSDLQKQFYDSYVASDGQAAADTYSARPGFSEHQTGFSADITSANGKCHLEICWENTNEGKWVRDNASKFGFIIRYKKGKDSITGYQYEPWHLRYVGKQLSAELTKTGLTLEEFFRLSPAPDYN